MQTLDFPGMGLSLAYWSVRTFASSRNTGRAVILDQGLQRIMLEAVPDSHNISSPLRILFVIPKNFGSYWRVYAIK